MPEVPKIVVKIEADLLVETRFRWLLCEGDQILLRCQHSYSTKEEAEIAWKEALIKRLTELRAKSLR
jgi:hypothetical protein